MRHALRAASIPAGFAAALLTGCIAVDNDRHTVGPAHGGPVVDPVSVAPTPATAGRQPVAAGVRASWPAIDFVVPDDPTYHAPTYAPRRDRAGTTARQRGEYPTALSSLEGSGGTNRAQAAEVFVETAALLGDAIMIVPRMFMQHPWCAVDGMTPTDRHQHASPPPAGAPASGAP